jgi:hypothetical protein
MNVDAGTGREMHLLQQSYTFSTVTEPVTGSDPAADCPEDATVWWMALLTTSDPNFFRQQRIVVRSLSLRPICHFGGAHGPSLNRATRSLYAPPHSLRNASWDCRKIHIPNT